MEYENARRTPRHAVIADIELTDVRSGIHISAQTKDLSLFGCGMESTKLFPKGTSVKIRLSHRGTEAWALARVVYSKLDLGMGVAFTSVEPEDQRILESWVAEFMCIPIREEWERANARSLLVPEGTAVEVEMTLPTQITLGAPMRVRWQGRIHRCELKAGDTAGMATAIEKYEFLTGTEDTA